MKDVLYFNIPGASVENSEVVVTLNAGDLLKDQHQKSLPVIEWHVSFTIFRPNNLSHIHAFQRACLHSHQIPSGLILEFFGITASATRNTSPEQTLRGQQ